MTSQTARYVAAALALTACQSEVSAPRADPSSAHPAAFAAREKSTPFEGFDFLCPHLPPSDPGVVTVTGNMVHIRGIINHSYQYSTNPLVAGAENVWVDVEFNSLNGAGSFTGILEIVPTALGGSGTWRGAFGGHLKGGKYAENPLTLVDSHIILHGTGTLEGLTIMLDHFVNLEFAHPAPPFPGCEFDGEKLVGVIFDPRS